MNRVDNLTKELDSSSLVLSLKDALKKVKKDKKLVSLLEEYSTYPKDEIKRQILENETFQDFKIKETDLNLFVMKLNQRLKVVSDRGNCHHEGH